MDRDKIITIVIGLFVGAVLAGLYFFGAKLLPKSLPEAPIIHPGQKVSPSPQPPAPLATSLTISQPEDNSSTTNNSVAVSGKALANTPVIIYANADEKIATSDGSGSFTAQIKLEPGENEITVTQIDVQGKIITAKRNVTLEIQ